MKLAFSKCKTPEDVARVYDEHKLEVMSIDKVSRFMKDIKEDLDEVKQ